MKRHGLLDLNEAVQHPGTKIVVAVETGLVEEADLDLVAPITGDLEAKSAGNILLLKGEFLAECTMECARCSEPINQKVIFLMSDEFQVDGVPACYGTGEHAVVVEEEEFPLFTKNAIDVDAYLRQGLIVNLPIQPLCDFGWEGPCPNAKSGPVLEPSSGHPSLQKLREMVHPEED